MPAILRRVSPRVYFDLEKGSEIRYEYVDGILFSMSGESRRWWSVTVGSRTAAGGTAFTRARPKW
jgi:hypothetical protein